MKRSGCLLRSGAGAAQPFDVGREGVEPQIDQLLVADRLQAIGVGMRAQQHDDAAVAQTAEFVAANNSPRGLLGILIEDPAQFVHPIFFANGSQNPRSDDVAAMRGRYVTAPAAS